VTDKSNITLADALREHLRLLRALQAGTTAWLPGREQSAISTAIDGVEVMLREAEGGETPTPPTPKPCPACGDTAYAEGDRWVTCTSEACRMIGPSRPTEAAAVAAWDEIAGAVEERDKLREENERLKWELIKAFDRRLEASAEKLAEKLGDDYHINPAITAGEWCDLNEAQRDRLRGFARDLLEAAGIRDADQAPPIGVDLEALKVAAYAEADKCGYMGSWIYPFVNGVLSRLNVVPLTPERVKKAVDETGMVLAYRHGTTTDDAAKRFIAALTEATKEPSK